MQCACCRAARFIISPIALLRATENKAITSPQQSLKSYNWLYMKKLYSCNDQMCWDGKHKISGRHYSYAQLTLYDNLSCLQEQIQQFTGVWSVLSAGCA